MAFRVLAANNTPDFRTISDFRKDHLGALSGLFLQVLMLCQRSGLVKLGHVALDGTKVRANASKHQAMSYRKMQEQEAQLSAEVAELLRQAQEVAEEEDRRYGRDKRGDELPEGVGLSGGAALEKIREAMAALEAEAQAQAEAAAAEGKAHLLECLRARPSAASPTRSPASCRGRVAGTSSERTTVRHGGGRHEHQVIVATRATNVASDKQQAVVMIEEAIANTGTVPREVSADAGYYSAPAVADLQALGTDPFVAPEKTRHGHQPPPAPRGRIPKDLSPRDRMRRKLPTKRGRQRYALRMGTVEPVFGQIKAGPRVPAVPAAGFGEGAGRVVADLHRPQPAQAVPLRWAGSRQRSATSHPHPWVFSGATFNQRDGVISPLPQLVSGPVSNPRTGC